MVIHFLRSRYVVIFLYSLKFAGTLLSEDCLNRSVSLVCTLRFSYLNEVIVPGIDAKWVRWITFVFLQLKIDALSFSGGVFSHHSLVELQWSLLFNTREDKIRAVQMTQVSQRLAQQLLLHGLVALGKLVVFGSNNGNWDKRSVYPFGVS